MNEVPRYDCFGVVSKVKDEGKAWWQKIGVGFTNRDGSINLRLDFIPTNPNTTIQLRQSGNGNAASPS